jgi:hypothetical protein
MTDPHDELDELLTPRPAAEPSAEFRDALRRRTGWQLVWRRRGHRIRVLVAVAAVFASGVAVGSAWKRAPAPAQRNLLFRLAQPEVVVVPVVVPVPASEPRPVPSSPEAPLTAGQYEVRAELADDPAEAARLYRLAGDRYLNDLEDYRNAARCYRLFLARAGDAGLSPAPGDTWLLTSLKNAAFKEKYDAASGSD